MKQQASKHSLLQIYNWLLLIVLFFLTNRRAFVCWYVVSLDYYCEYGSAVLDYIVWAMAVFVALLLAIQQGKYVAGVMVLERRL